MENNVITIQNKIELLIKDMGKSTFLKLLHFVVEVMEKDCAIKILMVRRFLDIFLEFEEIVQYLYDGAVKRKGVFVTNLSVVTMRESLENQTILVIDDIRLHGRALNEISSFLVEQCNCPCENITIKIFADNIDAYKVESKFYSNDNVEIKEAINENRWRKISSSIINSFYILGQPYVSHLPYCEFEFGSEEADVIHSFIQEAGIEEISTEIQRYYGVRGYLYFMDFDCDKDLESQAAFVEQNVIRIYIYEKLKKIVMIPYAFLKPLSFKGILSCYESLCKLGIIQEAIAPKIVCDTISVDDMEYEAKYLYSLITYALSMAIGQKFMFNKEIQNIIWRKEIEKYNFGCQIDLRSMDTDSFIEKMLDIIEGEYAESDDVNLQLSKDVEIENIITRIQKNKAEKPSAYKFLQSYLKLNSKRDEELALQGNSRIKGIEYLRLRKYFAESELRNVWKSIIRIVDTGRGTLTVSLNMINQRPYFDSLLFAGEQNFACNEPNLVYFIYPLIEYECFYQSNPELNKRSDESIMNAKSNMIGFILEKFPELRQEVDDYEMQNLKEKSLLKSGIDYYMSRFPVYEKDEKLKQVLKDTRHYMKG